MKSAVTEIDMSSYVKPIPTASDLAFKLMKSGISRFDIISSLGGVEVVTTEKMKDRARQILDEYKPCGSVLRVTLMKKPLRRKKWKCNVYLQMPGCIEDVKVDISFHYGD